MFTVMIEKILKNLNMTSIYCVDQISIVYERDGLTTGFLRPHLELWF
jgi:hypothetical protein